MSFKPVLAPDGTWQLQYTEDSPPDIQAAVNTAVPSAVATAVASMLSSATPQPEKTSPTGGTGTKVSRDDHGHPRLTSVTEHVLNASGEATVVFTRPFSVKPGWVPSYEEAADNQPVIVKVKTWTIDANSNYTGCVIKGYRASVTTVSLLGAQVNAFSGSASGVTISFTAIAKS